jgi:hypothetical protein
MLGTTREAFLPTVHRLLFTVYHAFYDFYDFYDFNGFVTWPKDDSAWQEFSTTCDSEWPFTRGVRIAFKSQLETIRSEWLRGLVFPAASARKLSRW